MSLFGSLFGSGYQDAANAQQQYALAGLQGAQGYLQQAAGDINTYGQQAQQPWSQIAPQALGGYNAYADITGAQGQAGQQRAQQLFQTDPGYQFAMNQALQATQRATGTGGFQDSGNVLTALQNQASGLAQQQYGNYVSRLAPYLQVAPQVAGAQSGISQWQGGNLANVAGAQGNLYSNTYNAIGQSQAAADIAQQNAQNSFLGGILGLGTKLLGYGGGTSGAGGTGLFGSAGPLFGGTSQNAWYNQ